MQVLYFFSASPHFIHDKEGHSPTIRNLCIIQQRGVFSLPATLKWITLQLGRRRLSECPGLEIRLCSSSFPPLSLFPLSLMKRGMRTVLPEAVCPMQSSDSTLTAQNACKNWLAKSKFLFRQDTLMNFKVILIKSHSLVLIA